MHKAAYPLHGEQVRGKNKMEICWQSVALGMYTVHRSVQKDMEGVFCALRKMGYSAIEFYGELNVFNPDIAHRALSRSGLELCGWHVEWRDLQPSRLAGTLDALECFGCATAIVPCLGGKWHIGHGAQEECLDVWLAYADQLNGLARTLASRGMHLGYHNHDHEFALCYEGKPVYEWLFDRLDPEILMELDTGNCIEGGADPCDPLRRYAGRGVLLHMKPFSHASGFDVTLGAAEDTNDWARIVSVPLVRYERFLIESEAQHLPEMENARLCIEAWLGREQT